MSDCVCLSVCTMVHLQRSECKLLESMSSSYHVGSRDQNGTQVPRLGRKYFYPLSHLACSMFYSLTQNLAMLYLELASTSQLSCLTLPSTRLLDVYHHIQFTVF